MWCSSWMLVWKTWIIRLVLRFFFEKTSRFLWSLSQLLEDWKCFSWQLLITIIFIEFTAPEARMLSKLTNQGFVSSTASKLEKKMSHFETFALTLCVHLCETSDHSLDQCRYICACQWSYCLLISKWERKIEELSNHTKFPSLYSRPSKLAKIVRNTIFEMN